ncbi:MAG: glycosyltransferase family 2 protein [Desulfobacteraceae bacterium]|nr:glycosyltransferase family 2 protein [Desulfobacteraceae bacterium]
MIKISAVILTLDEEDNIERCLQSVRDVADEIVVVDSFSKDDTESICRKYKVNFRQHAFTGFIEQKNWATAQAAHDHILSIEGDEAISDPLKQSILNVKHDWDRDAYYFNRCTRYCGKWITHTDWYPDRKLRLFDRRKGQFGGTNPHDRFIPAPGATKRQLKGDLHHYAFNSISEHILLANRYSDIKARLAYAAGKKCRWYHMVFHPPFKFIRSYVLKLGFMDGFHGMVISAVNAFSNFLKYAKLRRLQNEKIISEDD